MAFYIMWKLTKVSVVCKQDNTFNEHFVLRGLMAAKNWTLFWVKGRRKNWLLVSVRYLRRFITIFVHGFLQKYRFIPINLHYTVPISEK